MAPQIDERGLGRGSDLGVRRVLSPRAGCLAAQGKTVDLAGLCERKLIDHLQPRWDHMGRQIAAGGVPEGGPGKGRAGERNREGDQMLGAIRQGASDDRDVGDREVAPQHGFDMLGLDPAAIQLDLIVHAPEEMQQPCLVAPDEIAGAIEHLPRILHERVRDEFLLGKVGGVKITERQPLAAGIELPHRAFGDRAHFVIENVQNRARDRPANGDRRVGRQIRRRGEGRGEGRVLGRPVNRDEMTGSKKPRRFGDMRRRHDVAARDQIAKLAQWSGTLVDHKVEEAAGEKQGCHALFLDRGGDRVEAEQACFRNHQLGAIEQGAPNFENRRIESQGRRLQKDLVVRKPHIAGIFDQTDNRAMRDNDAFWLPRGAGGEHDAGGVRARSFHGVDPTAGGLRQWRGVNIDHRHRRRELWEAPQRCGVRNDTCQFVPLDNIEKALRRAAWVERHERPACFQHRQEGCDGG